MLSEHLFNSTVNNEDNSTCKLRQAAIACYKLAKLHYDATNFSQAEELFIQSINNLSPTEDIFTILKAMLFLIKISTEANNIERYNIYLDYADLIINKMADSPYADSYLYFYNKGIINFYRKNHEQAKEYFKKTILLVPDNTAILTVCYLYLAISHYESLDLDIATINLETTQELLIKYPKKYFSAMVNFYLGKIHLGRGLSIQALEYFDNALVAMQNKKYWHLYANILFWKGKAYQEMGEIQKALLLFEITEKSIDKNVFKLLASSVTKELTNLTGAQIDIHLDRTKRLIYEKSIGAVDFKHRFVLLDILFMLAKNPGKYYNKEDLAKQIWQNNYNPLIHDKLVYTSISRLRQLIEPQINKPSYILRGKDGYAFSQLARVKFFVDDKLINNKAVC